MNLNEEYDIPGHHKLEKKIINDLLEESNNEDRGFPYNLKNGSIIHMMKKFLTYVDELNSIYQIYSPCKKGCSSCCDIAVAVSDLEVIIIKEYLDKNRIAYHKLDSMKKKQENAGKKDGFLGKEYTGVKCPFLKYNDCSIYSVRPFVCRKYIVIGECNMERKNRKGKHTMMVDEQYIINATYDLITTHHIRKNLERYISILDPIQIKVTQQANLNGVYNLLTWQKLSDIRDNFSDIWFN